MTPMKGAGGFARIVTHDTLGSTNAEALALARAGERRAALDHGRAPDRGPRAARQCLDLRAGQSLCEPAADRCGAARASSGAVLRGGAGRA